MISPSQFRAARAMLGWRQADLAEKAGVSPISIKNIERGATKPRASTVLAIQDAFDNADVEFIDRDQVSAVGGVGVRFKD